MNFAYVFSVILLFYIRFMLYAINVNRVGSGNFCVSLFLNSCISLDYFYTFLLLNKCYHLYYLHLHCWTKDCPIMYDIRNQN